MRGCRLKGSELFAEPSLAELASHKGRLHSDASLHILEYESIAMWPDRDTETTTDAMHVIPAS
jgi:hypothetical protein